MSLERITPRSQKPDQWYTDVVTRAKLMDYGPVAGTMIVRPNGWAIWQAIVRRLDREFAKLGVQNVSMPTLIPMEQFAKEQAHIKGFAPELFYVERVGDYKLPSPYVVRPTSEVTFSNHYAHIVKSYNDLPLLYNQWCSVMRAEKTTRPFLRTSEFHWQEGHTVHADKKEAKLLARKILRVYAKVASDLLCIPVVAGEKTANERFAGAVNTFTIESLMHDGKALQCATSHFFGQNFASIYGIKYQAADNSVRFAEQTSWGMSTRIIGALIMSHADDRGIVLPSAVAPVQVAVLTVGADRDERVASAAQAIAKSLRGVRVKVDLSNKGLGYKLAEQEVLGTPLRIEVGPRDVDNKACALSFRIGGNKETVALEAVAKRVKEALKQVDRTIRESAERVQRVAYANSYDELKALVRQGGFVAAPWAGSADDEQKIKDETTATIRCIPFKQPRRMPAGSKCVFTGKPAGKYALFALAY